MRPVSDQSVLPDEKKVFRILIADDHAIVRIGLAILIKNMDNSIHIEEATDGESVIRQLKSGLFDLLILDINMPGTESFSLTRYLKEEFPPLKILVFTINQEVLFAKRFLKLGVHGYIIKQFNESEIGNAIRTIMDGHVYISDMLIGIISNDIIGNQKHNPFEKLSDREFGLVLQILKGYEVKEIAHTLHLNESTVRTHRSRIMKKLKLSGTVDLMNLAKQHNLL